VKKTGVFLFRSLPGSRKNRYSYVAESPGRIRLAQLVRFGPRNLQGTISGRRRHFGDRTVSPLTSSTDCLTQEAGRLIESQSPGVAGDKLAEEIKRRRFVAAGMAEPPRTSMVFCHGTDFHLPGGGKHGASRRREGHDHDVYPRRRPPAEGGLVANEFFCPANQAALLVTASGAEARARRAGRVYKGWG